MTTLWTLRCLYSLDTSSPDFLHRLYSLFHHDEDEQYLSNLQGSELDRLVDFLDQVRTLPSAFRQLRNRLPRPLVPFPPTAICLKNVSTNYEPSVAIARPFHHHVSYLVKSPKWAVVQSPLAPSPMYGKPIISPRKSPSSVLRFPRAMIGPLRCVQYHVFIASAQKHMYGL